MYTFKEDKSDLGYYHLYSNGTWNIGIYPVLFGNRIRIWRTNDQGCVADICCGSKASVLTDVYNQLLIYLSEDGDPRQIPHQTQRPFPKDNEAFTEWLAHRWQTMSKPYEVNITESMLASYRQYHMSEFVANIKYKKEH